MQCPNHPDRPVLDPYWVDRQICQECLDRRLDGYADQKRERNYGPDYDLTPWGELIRDPYRDQFSLKRKAE